MFTFLSILIIVLSLVIVLMVIVQNPKGGGTMGSFAGAASNVIGVQRAGDILEKGTWGGAILLLLLCVLTVFVAPKVKVNTNSKTITEEAARTAPASTAPVAPLSPTTTPSNPITEQTPAQ